MAMGHELIAVASRTRVHIWHYGAKSHTNGNHVNGRDAATSKAADAEPDEFLFSVDTFGMFSVPVLSCHTITFALCFAVRVLLMPFGLSPHFSVSWVWVQV